MKKEVVNRIKECWLKLADTIEQEPDCCDSTMLIASGEIGGRKFQVQIKITTDEIDFLTTGFGEIEL